MIIDRRPKYFERAEKAQQTPAYFRRSPEQRHDDLVEFRRRYDAGCRYQERLRTRKSRFLPDVPEPVNVLAFQKQRRAVR